ncbi:hypothetical protein BCM40_06645 [Planococcus donghaensis]|uniref:Uncharacterized protein n=1 Tax=Planococcus donghaensis TaxID=414778 RepID=A0A1C7EH70_9BACL|nr:DUF2691 family protein [Planococcus donghaensis]ANU23065.1 hypothetical protein BCM40_06645 [Planococcus donghaensis]
MSLILSFIVEKNKCMRRGISFEIPNEWGKWLEEVFKPVDISTYYWQVGSRELYTMIDNESEKELFQNDRTGKSINNEPTVYNFC